ncbi:class GN sortase [Marinobacter alexandrii]|uniref:class GN sortase n=1 Tax=Marinobacter alexandrii TaxID=2570351 RepID=UPI0032976422
MPSLPKVENWRDVLALCLVLLGLQQVGSAGLIEAKARIAPLLIDRAWDRSLESQQRAVKPWPWADTWPVGKLHAPSVGIELPVLYGDSGNVLAFGPGYSPRSSPPDQRGLTVISGHRDTHFAPLADIHLDEVLQLEGMTGALRLFRVNDIRVVDTRKEQIQIDNADTGLMLVTCYPFDALSVNGPLRYVVHAEPLVNESALSQVRESYPF